MGTMLPTDEMRDGANKETEQANKMKMLHELVTIPTELNIDVLAEAFFLTTGHGKMMKWAQFKHDFVTQSNFFKAGVFAVMKKVCEISGCEMDSSKIKQEITAKLLREELKP